MKRTFLYVVLLLFLPFFLTAQLRINGVVTDSNTGESIPYVQITLGDQNWNSDREGNFKIESKISEGLIQFNRIGYYSRSVKTGDLDQNEPSLNIKLDEKPVVFGEIIIEESPDHSIPQSDEIIDAIKMISQPMDAGDLLSGVAGFGMSKRGAYSREPVFRSFRQEQLNILFDGFIQYNHACPNRMDPNVTHVIPAEIKKVEIIKGPFSVRYGPSMGATLNYLTESSADQKDGFSGSIESGYEFNGKGKSARASGGFKKERFDLYLNGSIKNYGDYQSGNDSIIPSSFNSKDYGIKLGINPTNTQRLLFTWKQSFLRDADYAGLAMDARTDNSSLAALSYKWKNLHPNVLSMEINAFGDQVDHIMDNDDRKNFKAVEAVSTVLADTYGGKLEFNIAPGKKDLLFAGIDVRTLYRDGVRTRLVKKNLQTGVDLPEPKSFTDKIWQDSRMLTAGFFGENKWYPNALTTITSGVRVDYVRASINDPAEDFASLYELEDSKEINISGNLSASYRLKRGFSMQLALGRGVRSATIDERYINHFAVGKDPYELVGNPDLKPEVNHQLEYALRYQNSHLDVQLSAFYSIFGNLITAAVDSLLPRKYSPWLEPKFAKRFVNVENAYQTGLEISGDYALTRAFKIHGQFAYTYAQNTSWDEPISRIPPMEGGLKLSFEKPKWWVSADARFVAKQTRVAESFGEVETPGFSLFNARFGLKPVKGLILGFTVENILDTEYVEFLNWSFNKLIGEGLVREPGRNISLYGRYKF